MSLCNCSHQFCKKIPISFDFITTWNQGVFLCSPCSMAHLHVRVHTDEQDPLRNLSFKTTDGFSNHNFTNQVVYLLLRPPTFPWFCQHVTIRAPSHRKSLWSQLCWYWNNSIRQDFNLPDHTSITWRMRKNGMWPIDSRSLWNSRFFFPHASEVNTNIKGRHKTSLPSKLILATLCYQNWQPSK
jgi:hypothetical protein